MRKGLIVSLTFIIFRLCCLGQADSVKSCRSFFIEPELMVGRIVPNYHDYPTSGLRETVVLNIGSSNIDDKPWGQYYNHPAVGVSLAFSQLGNQSVFGNEIDLMPFITLNTTRRQRKTWFFRLGLGASYFTKRYDTLANPLNDAIGSSVTWAFKVFAYRTVFVSDKFTLCIGGGYCHSSDAHTALPNLGLNSGLVGISAQFRNHGVDKGFVYQEKVKEKIPRNYFVQIYAGAGMHVRGNPFGPTGGPTYGVTAANISGGVILRNHIKLRAGFTYRDYGQLMDYMNPPYSTVQSSNIFFSLGCEMLVGHFGLDVEGGINIYKPFYYQFYKNYEGSTSSTFYYLKSIFPVRLGLNYYIISPYKKGLMNLFIGAHIDANFGQADFCDLALGCSINCSRKK